MISSRRRDGEAPRPERIAPRVRWSSSAAAHPASSGTPGPGEADLEMAPEAGFRHADTGRAPLNVEPPPPAHNGARPGKGR